MTKKISVDVIVDNKYSEPKVEIYTKTKSQIIENIVEAIKNVDESDFLFILAYLDGKLKRVAISDIIRISRNDRKIIVETDEASYIIKKTLTQLEDELDKKRFIRISQSEIINLYKVKSMDVSVIGTIIIEFNNEKKSYVSRRYVKLVKDVLNNQKEEEV